MDDITLVNLSYGFKERGDPGSLVPLGCLYLSSALEEYGYRVDFRDYQLNTFAHPFDTGSFLSFLDDSADILGIGCCSDSLPLVIAALKKYKAEYPGKIIILGGVGPTGVAREILKKFPFIDIIVKGEGERTVIELMNRLTTGWGWDLRRVGGIVYREGKKIYRTPSRPRIRNLDELPFPAYHKINLDDYAVLGLVSARGCPYRCAFCDAAPFWKHRVYKRDVEQVIREIRLFYKEFSGKQIQLYDETFTLDRERVLYFCRRLKEERLDIRWSVMTRIDLMDKELMKEMSGSGCNTVLYGIESGSDRVLETMGKKYTVKEAGEKILQSLDYFQVWAPVIWGFPFETMADFRETMEFVSYIDKSGAVPLLYQLAPFPLSPLYAEYKDTLKFSRELYDAGHLVQNDDIINLIDTYPRIFPGFCYYEAGNVPEKYPFAREHQSIPFLP